MSIFDVLYQAGLQRPPEAEDRLRKNPTSAVSTFDFNVAHSARAGCHVIFSISGLRADRTHRWLITVRDQAGKVSHVISSNANAIPQQNKKKTVTPIGPETRSFLTQLPGERDPVNRLPDSVFVPYM